MSKIKGKISNGDRTALLVMDVQAGIVERLDAKKKYIKQLKMVIKSAHLNQIPVIFVVVGFRLGMPEISTSNKSFNAIKENDTLKKMVNPTPSIKPSKDDIVVNKLRVSAFTGSDLEVILRAQNIRHLVLSGIATSGVVLSTLREAADKDYALTVLSDLCADFDNEVHKLLTEKIFPRQAEVMSSKEWIKKVGNLNLESDAVLKIS